MTARAIGALRADRDAILELGTGLTEADWAAASGCPGWSAKDVVAHMGALLRLVLDPSSLPDTTGPACGRGPAAARGRPPVCCGAGQVRAASTSGCCRRYRCTG
jgi:uncharacterized protein (TIGR03083 family)